MIVPIERCNGSWATSVSYNEAQHPVMNRRGRRKLTHASRANWAALCVFSPTSPSLSVMPLTGETSRPAFLRSGVTGLLEASVGR